MNLVSAVPVLAVVVAVPRPKSKAPESAPPCVKVALPKSTRSCPVTKIDNGLVVDVVLPNP